MYAPEDIRLPAQRAVQVPLGYRVNLQPHLMIHTFATTGLKNCEIWAMEIHDGEHQHQSSTLLLANLADHSQRISKGAALCTALITIQEMGESGNTPINNHKHH
ncbi:MAG: hypothetical protein GY696_35600 [Gammaproteobacteria bacterium]|nr:hypothetical protein [Gammaproteobacteria bacterium]